MRAALRIAAVILLTPILLFVAIIQIDQHILRHRAEQLNADLQPLMRRPGTWADLQRIQTRWGRYGHYEGTCTADHCAYCISLNSLPENLSPRRWRSIPIIWDMPPWLYRLYRLAGGNASYVVADLRLTRNRLWGTKLMVVTGPDSRGVDGRMLFARLVFGPRLFSYESGETGIHVQSWKDGYITDFPGFCTGCVGGYTSITPFTPTDQFDRLSRVNFSCLTRLIPCQAVDQILPAWKKRPYDEDNWGDPHCLVPLDVRAREADNILLVEVARNTPNLEWGPNHWATYVHILDKLKNAPNEEVGSSFGIAEMGAFLNPVTLPAPSKTSPSPPLPVGARYVVLYPEERLPLDKTPDPSACSVTLATPQNIALIQSGIAQDPSVGESYHLRD